MSDFATELPAWLYGTEAGGPSYSQGIARIPAYSPGILQRLLQSFQGDPVGPAQTALAVDTAKSLTVPDLANSCIVTVETQAVRLQVDGTVPTSSKGLLFPVGAIITLSGRGTLQAAQFISAVAGCLINVCYFN